MKHLFLLLTALFLERACFAQFNIAKPDSASLPKGIVFKGHIVNTASWVDSLGENVVILTETGEYQSTTIKNDDSYRDAALYAYHYLIQKDSVKLLWRVYDFTKECPVDLYANFIKNTFAVTDLNHNGKAEIWLMYKTVCHGDVSPSTMKIIMYEGDQKFAVRGMNKVRPSANEFVGGEYSFDDAFKTGPEVFRQYAQQLWQKNIMETWE
jgi:hypothetical protein